MFLSVSTLPAHHTDEIVPFVRRDQNDRMWRLPTHPSSVLGSQEVVAEDLVFKNGTMADTMLTAAIGSTNNAGGDRGPQMKQIRNYNQRYCGRKPNIGVDSYSELVHRIAGTLANVNDVTQSQRLASQREGRCLWRCWDSVEFTCKSKPKGRSDNWSFSLACPPKNDIFTAPHLAGLILQAFPLINQV